MPGIGDGAGKGVSSRDGAEIAYRSGGTGPSPDEPPSVWICDAERLGRDGRDEIVTFCSEAYDEDFSRFFEQMSGSIHVIARDRAGVLLSHAAWVPRALEADGRRLRCAYVEAVATAASHRRRGLATAVMRRLVTEVCARDFELAALSPSDPAFYARLGWEQWRGSLAISRDGRLEPSPDDEMVMIMRTPRTPPDLEVSASLTAGWREGELW